MATVFWERKGVLMVKFVQQGISNVRNTKKEKNAWGHSEKRHEMLTSGVFIVLLHDNARPHRSTAARTRVLLEHFNWELFDHHPYSPYLAPSDYNLFTYLKNWLRSQRFNNYEELMQGVKTWLSSHAADFSDTSVRKLIPRYDKRLSSGGDYDEK
jgi:hypothetical protein